jgi:predicted nucleotide-binding protein
MSDAPLVFFSYARSDSELVRPVALELRARGIDVWIDAEKLLPGQIWENVISEALERVDGLIVFLSRSSLSSQAIVREAIQAIGQSVLIIPVLLEPLDASSLPADFASHQWLDLSRFRPEEAAGKAADAIVKAFGAMPPRPSAAGRRKESPHPLARALAAQMRGASEGPASATKAPPDSVFIVHGHDETLLHNIVGIVEDLGVKAIVMKKIGGASTSLLEKFLDYGTKARYAIVLLSGDDFGAARTQFEEQDVGERALQYRARQNVVLELGFFYGKLGWENVFVLERAPPKVFPNFERPSDLGGALYDRYDEAGQWRATLYDWLRARGFNLKAREAILG